MQDVGGAIHAYQQALVYEPASRRARRARSAVPPHRAVGAARSTSCRAARSCRPTTPRSSGSGSRSARSGTCGCSTPARRSPRTRRCSSSTRRTCVALRALEALYEKTEQTEKYLEVLEAQLDASPSDAERVVAVRAHGRGVGGAVRQARSRRGGAREDRRDRSRATTAAYRELARLYQQAGKWEALVETYRNHIMATTDVATRVELYVAMGQVYETAAQRRRSRDRGVQRRAVVRRRRAARARCARPALREDRRVGPRDRRDGAPRRADARTRASRSSCTARMGRIQYGQLGDADGAEANLLARRSRIDPGHVPDDGGADQAVLGSRRLAEGRADDGARRELHAGRDRQGAPAVRGRAASTRTSCSQDDQAKQLYAAVIALDPEHVEAGRPLAELYFDDQAVGRAVAGDRHAVPQGRRSSHADPRELNELYYRAATTRRRARRLPEGARLLQGRATTSTRRTCRR